MLDYGNGRVQIFDNGGAFLRTVGTPGEEAGELTGLIGIALDGEGYVYVATEAVCASAVHKFSTGGEFIDRWYGDLREYLDDPSGSNTATMAACMSPMSIRMAIRRPFTMAPVDYLDEELVEPGDVAVNLEAIYVLDWEQVVKYSLDGEYLNKWNSPSRSGSLERLLRY
ncbi:MAG: hypothetical protein R3A46_21730 [Thermomicrobiales bacterium]